MRSTTPMLDGGQIVRFQSLGRANRNQLSLTNGRKRVMSDSADREKYGPLGEFLAALPPATNEITLLFDKVSQIIGDALPPLHLNTANGGPTRKAGRVRRAGGLLGSKSIKSTVRKIAFSC
jgi:hypothetical protein